MIPALLLCVFGWNWCFASVPTEEESRFVCLNWLLSSVDAFGPWAGSTQPTIIDQIDLTSGNTLLARCYLIAPEGHVVVPALKELPPVMACSDKHGIDARATNGYTQILRQDIDIRLGMYAERYGSLIAEQKTDTEPLFGRAQREQWTRLSVDSESFKENMDGAECESRESHGPLIDSSWDQLYPFNVLCPLIDGVRAPVGCVALAAAQIMRYWQWPSNGSGSHSYSWNGVTLSADFSDLYDWGFMKDSYGWFYTEHQKEAVSELCFEVGVAFETDYDISGSSAYMGDGISIYPTYFRYMNTITREDRNDYTPEGWSSLIRSEIFNSRPMHYKMYGHSLVCDGWRELDGIDQYHMNFGYEAESYNTWYTIDDLPGDTHPPVTNELLKGIKPPPWAPRPHAPPLPITEATLLIQNIPNPFDARTEICYDLSVPGPVIISMHDLYGREITRLIDNEMMPTGSHRLVWEPEGIPAGVYIYKIVTIEDIVTRRAVYLGNK